MTTTRRATYDTPPPKKQKKDIDPVSPPPTVATAVAAATVSPDKPSPPADVSPTGFVTANGTAIVPTDTGVSLPCPKVSTSVTAPATEPEPIDAPAPPADDSLSDHDSAGSTMTLDEETALSDDEEVTLDDAAAFASMFETAAEAAASKTSDVSEGYRTKKRKVIQSFIDGLKKINKKYEKFLPLVQDPPSHIQVRPCHRVFVLLSKHGDADKDKRNRILSGMLVDWIDGLRLEVNPRNQAQNWPSPGSINGGLRAFFAATKELYLWDYNMLDFRFDGGFKGWLKNLYAERTAVDVSCKFL